MSENGSHDRSERDDYFRIRKSVSLTLLAGILANIGHGVWQASATATEFLTLKKSVAENTVKVDAIVRSMQSIAEKTKQDIKSDLVDDREFHVSQRIRMWNRINTMKDTQQELSARIQALEAVAAHTNKMVAQLLDIQLRDREERKNNN